MGDVNANRKNTPGGKLVVTSKVAILIVVFIF